MRTEIGEDGRIKLYIKRISKDERWLLDNPDLAEVVTNYRRRKDEAYYKLREKDEIEKREKEEAMEKERQAEKERVEKEIQMLKEKNEAVEKQLQTIKEQEVHFNKAIEQKKEAAPPQPIISKPLTVEYGKNWF